jgi:hypothetical protein
MKSALHAARCQSLVDAASNLVADTIPRRTCIAPRDSFCVTATDNVDTIVPIWMMLRMSLSSDAAASLETALSLAAVCAGRQIDENHTAASG